VIAEATSYVAKEKIIPCTNCGMAPMRREIANAKLKALGEGAKLARERLGRGRAAKPASRGAKRATKSSLRGARRATKQSPPRRRKRK